MQSGLTMWLVKIVLTFGAFWVLGQHASWACSYPSTDSLHQAQKDCTQRPDRSWSCDLHRCIATREVLQVESDLAQCDAIENHEEANRCRVKTAKELTEAQKAVDLGKNKLKTKNYLGLGTQSILGSYYLLAGFSQKAGSSCGSLAAKLLAAGGGSAIMGALWASWRLKTNAKKLQQQYRKLVESKSVKNAQVEAFDYLISEQKAVARAAKSFATANNLAAGLFAAGAIAATFDQLKPPAGCAATTRSLLRPPSGAQERGGLLVLTEEPPGNGMGLETVKTLGQLSGKKLLALAFPLAHGGQGLLATLLPAGAGVGLGVLLKRVQASSINPLQNFFNTPYGQITLGSVGAAVSLYAASVYSQEAKAAEKRSRAVQEMRDAFAKRVGFSACPQRNDPREPQCFCFIRENIINPERKTSQACQEYFVQAQGEWDPRTYSRYEVVDKDRPACLTRQGLLDPECLCREQKISNGDNNCQKTSINLTKFNGLGVSPIVGGMVRDANYLTNGRTPLSKLNSAGLGQGAINLRKALVRASSSVDKELRKRGRGGVAVTPALLRKGLGAINRALGSGAMAAARQFNGALGASSSQGHVAPEVKKIFRQMQRKMRRGKWSKNNARRGEDINSLLGLDKKGPPARDQASLEGGSQYDYKGHDIHPPSGASIWEVLSNRYQQTGLSRLFKAQP